MPRRPLPCAAPGPSSRPGPRPDAISLPVDRARAGLLHSRVSSCIHLTILCLPQRCPHSAGTRRSQRCSLSTPLPAWYQPELHGSIAACATPSPPSVRCAPTRGQRRHRRRRGLARGTSKRGQGREVARTRLRQWRPATHRAHQGGSGRTPPGTGEAVVASLAPGVQVLTTSAESGAGLDLLSTAVTGTAVLLGPSSANPGARCSARSWPAS